MGRDITLVVFFNIFVTLRDTVFVIKQAMRPLINLRQIQPNRFNEEEVSGYDVEGGLR